MILNQQSFPHTGVNNEFQELQKNAHPFVPTGRTWLRNAEPGPIRRRQQQRAEKLMALDLVSGEDRPVAIPQDKSSRFIKEGLRSPKPFCQIYINWWPYDSHGLYLSIEGRKGPILAIHDQYVTVSDSVWLFKSIDANGFLYPDGQRKSYYRRSGWIFFVWILGVFVLCFDPIAGSIFGSLP